jgi:hypothetical protein
LWVGDIFFILFPTPTHPHPLHMCFSTPHKEWGVEKIFLNFIFCTTARKKKSVGRLCWLFIFTLPRKSGWAERCSALFFYFLFICIYMFICIIMKVLGLWRGLRSSGRREASRMRYLLRCGPASRRPTHPPHLRCGWPKNKEKIIFLNYLLF